MSSTIASPINVKTSQSPCQNTCFYSFNYDYSNSNCTITNETDHLKFSYDSTSSIVVFNDVNYTVEEIRLYKPSLNKYYNSHVDAELIINHSGDGGTNVVVCIPIISSDSKSSSNTLFHQIIPYAPTSKDPIASINVNNYSLNYFLPRGSYYSYTGTLPYSTSSEPNNIIIFDSAKVTSNMSTSDMKLLTSLITTPSNIPPLNNSYNIKNLFYNSAGTTNDELLEDDDIYIDCKLIDSSGNATDVANTQSSTSSSFNMADITDNIGFQIFVGVAAVTIIYKLIRMKWPKDAAT